MHPRAPITMLMVVAPKDRRPDRPCGLIDHVATTAGRELSGGEGTRGPLLAWKETHAEL